MYGCLSGIILVNAACTRSWLAIAPEHHRDEDEQDQQRLARWKIQYEILPTQYRRTGARERLVFAGHVSSPVTSAGASVRERHRRR